MTLPTMQQLIRAVGQLLLFAGAISVVAAAYAYPETRMPIVVWLITVVLVQRPSPGDSR